MGIRRTFIAAAALLLCVAPAVAAVHYDFVDLHNPTYSNDDPVDIGGGKQVGNNQLAATGVGRPVLWSGTADSAIDMTPPGYDSAALSGTSATHQVGIVIGPSTGGWNHAALWNSTPESVVDLHGPSPGNSEAVDVSGSQQVGNRDHGPFGQMVGHAALWHGTPESHVDLHPTNHIVSSAVATSGARQGGWTITPFSSGRRRAVVWSGTAASAQLLNSDGLLESEVTDVTDSDAVGVGLFQSSTGFFQQRAYLWRDGARIELTDEWSRDTMPTGMNERFQVGYAAVTDPDPLRWEGSTESCLNLRQFMPPEYGSAMAVGIDENDNILGRADVFNTTTGLWETHAVMWVVPEPSAAATILGAAAIRLLAFRRRRR